MKVSMRKKSLETYLMILVYIQLVPKDYEYGIFVHKYTRDYR